MGRVTGHAAPLHDPLRLFERDGLLYQRRGLGARSRFECEREGTQQPQDTRGNKPPVTTSAEVHRVLEARAERHDAQQHEPVERVPIRAGEVRTQHEEQHREREVVVVRRAQLGAQPETRIDFGAGLGRRQHLLLGGDDPPPDIARHDRSEHRAHLKIGGAASEHLREAVSARSDQRHRDEACAQGAFAKRRTPQQVVHEPSRHQQSRADRHGAAMGEADPAFQEIGLAAQPVDDGEQEEATDPRAVRLPLECEQLRGHILRPQVASLDDLVEAAAVHQPDLTRDRTLTGPTRGRQAAVQPHEQERVPDPHDRGHHVRPAQQQVQPFEQQGIHRTGFSKAGADSRRGA